LTAYVATLLLAVAAPPKDPITDEMRQALDRANKVHNGMDRKTIDEAVEELHREIVKHDPAVFVPLAVRHLLLLAPKDTRTRAVLRRALAGGWIEEPLARAFLIEAGDTPGPHVAVLIKCLDSDNAKVRSRAMNALGACREHGASALPRLKQVVEKAKADPSDYRRAYNSTQEVPEHVQAHRAITRIEAALAERPK
jgi:hypothetical protein